MNIGNSSYDIHTRLALARLPPRFFFVLGSGRGIAFEIEEGGSQEFIPSKIYDDFERVLHRLLFICGIFTSPSSLMIRPGPEASPFLIPLGSGCTTTTGFYYNVVSAAATLRSSIFTQVLGLPSSRSRVPIAPLLSDPWASQRAARHTLI